MIDIGPLLEDCPFRVFCTFARGEKDDEQLSISADVSTPSNEQRNNLGSRD